MLRTALLFLCLLAFGAGEADSTLVFERPAADPFTAGTFFSDFARPREAATSFQLADAAELHGVAWRGGYFDGATPAAPVAFVIQLFVDAAGLPVAVPFYRAELLADFTELPGPFVEFAYTADLPQVVTLPGDVPFWISIVESDDTTGTFAWRKASEAGVSFSRAGASGGWQAFAGTGGFTLEGALVPVPEPTATLLLSVGMLGLAGTAVRRRGPSLGA